MTPERAQELAAWQQDLAHAGCIAESGLVAALMLMQDLERPLLLEAISCEQAPELGTVRAITLPLAVITSNGTCALSDAWCIPARLSLFLAVAMIPVSRRHCPLHWRSLDGARGDSSGSTR